MQDSNGDDYILTPSGVQSYSPLNPSAGTFSNKTDSSGDVHYYDEDGDIVLWKDDPTALGAADVLLFTGDTFYFPSNEQLFVNGGSRYSINYHIEPVGGSIVTTYVSEYTKSSGVSTSSATSTVTADSERFKKIISRIGLQTTAQNMNIRFKAADDFLPHNATDQIVIKDWHTNRLCYFCQKFACHILKKCLIYAFSCTICKVLMHTEHIIAQ